VLDPPAEDWVEEARPPASFNARRRPSPFSPTNRDARDGPVRYDLQVLNDARYEVNKPDVVDESVDGEVLIVHLGTGTYYSSRGAGDSAWQLLASGRTASESAGPLGLAEAEVQEFLDQLVSEGLLRPRTAEAAHLAEFRPVSGPLLLEKYTDMQELLLLDPIHDVDEEEGWPTARAGTAEAEA
jgi:hypothetical protein